MVDKDRCVICLRPGYTLWGMWKGTVLDACVELGKYLEDSFRSTHLCVQHIIYEDTPRTNHRAKVSQFHCNIFPPLENSTQMEFSMERVFKRPFATKPIKLGFGNNGNGLLMLGIHYTTFEQFFALICSLDDSIQSEGIKHV